MKRKIQIIVIALVFSAMFLIIFSCGSYLNGNEEEHNIASRNMNVGAEEELILRNSSLPTTVATIEELENLLIFSRAMKIMGFSNDEDTNISEIGLLYNVPRQFNISHSIDVALGIKSYYIPSENAFEGFELLEIDINRTSICYLFMPIGACPSESLGIIVRLIRPEHVDETDPLGSILTQKSLQRYGIALTEDGFLYMEKPGIDNVLFAQVGNTWMSMDVAEHLGGYDFLRTLALTEFTLDNIVSVDEMIAQRFRERGIVVTFPGMSGVTVSHFTDFEWVEVGTFDNSASFSVPNGTSHVRTTRDSMEHTFMLPRADDFVTVLSLPTATLDIIGVSVYGDNVNIAQNDSVVNVPVPANIFFQSFGNEGEYWAILISKAGGNYPFIVTVTDMDADFSEYFYDIRVPAGVTNLSIQSNDTYIVDIADGISGGGTITLLKTGQPASMSFTLGGTARNVNFTLDGSDPFAGFR